MSLRQEGQRYDDVEIVNIVEGKIIAGHDAVQAHFEREQKLLEAHGPAIIFQVYRLNLQADTLQEVQGEKLTEIKVDGDFVSAADTVAVVKDKLRVLLAETPQSGQKPDGLIVDLSDRLTLYLNGRPLPDNATFYDDNQIVLPVWIQALLHGCESEKAVQLINRLQA